MLKLPLESFLKAVSLGGRIESAKIVSDGTKTTTAFRDLTNNVFGFLEEHIPLPVGVYCVSDIRKLLSILGILADDIHVDVVYRKDTDVPLQIVLSDTTTTVNYALANEKNIPGAPAIGDMTLTLNTEWKLSEDIVEPIMKAIRILSDDAVMTITSEKSILIGKPSGNSTTATIKLPETEGTIPNNISFTTEHINAIIAANSLFVENSILSVYNDKLMKISFNSNREYFIPKKNLV